MRKFAGDLFPMHRAVIHHVFIVLALVNSLNAFSMGTGDATRTLDRGDSLYRSKRYAEALVQYESLYEEGFASPAALLRSAYIQEGTGNIHGALMNLYRYYRITNDQEAYFKILEMAEANELTGYESTEVERFLRIIQRWSSTLLLFLTASIILVLIWIWKRNSRLPQTIRLTVAFSVLVLLVGLYVLNNHIELPQKAMVAPSGAHLMLGASAAADRGNMAKAGDLMTVVGSSDIWKEVEYLGQRAYVRQHELISL